MSRLSGLAAEDLAPELQAVLDFARETMGFTPNDVLTMARWPALLQAMAPLVAVIFSPGSTNMELKRLVVLVASAAGGCRYCTAHSAHGLAREGVSRDKLGAAWEFESSRLFSEAERPSLDYARAAAKTPSAVTDKIFARLRRNFSDQQILEITAVIALSGFLNRWNASLATTLEPAPLALAGEVLAGTGWSPGIHAPATRQD